MGSQTRRFGYNAANQLTSIASGYDMDGRRVTQSNGSQVTHYLSDETSPYVDLALETDGNGSPMASYALAGAQLVSQTRGGETFYYLQDGQSSTRTLSNSTGTITHQYAYTAFGGYLRTIRRNTERLTVYRAAVRHADRAVQPARPLLPTTAGPVPHTGHIPLQPQLSNRDQSPIGAVHS
jgi:hypothetical protein